MIGRKITVLGSAAAVLVSSAIGATVLRSPDAKADLEIPDAAEGVSALEETTLDLVEQVTGAGETVLLVVGGVAPSVTEGAKLRDRLNASFGDVQGFYLDSAANYEVTGALVRVGPDVATVLCAGHADCPPGRAAVDELQPVRLSYVPLTELVSLAGDVSAKISRLTAESALVFSAFRTKRGAEEFIELARAAGLDDLITLQARKVGGGDVGLGQEPHPDGSGPLTGPLPNQVQYQQ